MTKHEARRLIRIADDIEGLTPGPASDLRQLARAALSQGRGPAKVKVATVAFAERRRAKDEEREAARKAAEYDAVERRAGARCEVTGAALSVTNSLVIHHIVYGQGVDRDKVTVADLMIRVLGSVHRQIHRSPLLWEREMKEWAASHGYTRAWNEIDRRCEKARAASRRTA
jgi:hypothetical protein